MTAALTATLAARAALLTTLLSKGTTTRAAGLIERTGLGAGAH